MATKSEDLLALLLKSSGIHFLQEHQIGPCHVDFFIPSSKLIIEVDGFYHSKRKSLDIKRDNAMKKRGFKVLRLWNGAISRQCGDGAMRKILLAMGNPQTYPHPILST